MDFGNFSSSDEPLEEKSQSIESIDDIQYLKDHLETKDLPQNEDQVLKIKNEMNLQGQAAFNKSFNSSISMESIDDILNIKEYLQNKDVSENEQCHQENNKITDQQIAQNSIDIKVNPEIQNMNHQGQGHENQKKLQNNYFHQSQQSSDNKLFSGQNQNTFQENQQILKNNQIENQIQLKQNFGNPNIQYNIQQIEETKNQVIQGSDKLQEYYQQQQQQIIQPQFISSFQMQLPKCFQVGQNIQFQDNQQQGQSQFQQNQQKGQQQFQQKQQQIQQYFQQNQQQGQSQFQIQQQHYHYQQQFNINDDNKIKVNQNGITTECQNYNTNNLLQFSQSQKEQINEYKNNLSQKDQQYNFAVNQPNLETQKQFNGQFYQNIYNQSNKVNDFSFESQNQIKNNQAQNIFAFNKNATSNCFINNSSQDYLQQYQVNQKQKMFKDGIQFSFGYNFKNDQQQEINQDENVQQINNEHFEEKNIFKQNIQLENQKILLPNNSNQIENVQKQQQLIEKNDYDQQSIQQKLNQQQQWLHQQKQELDQQQNTTLFINQFKEVYEIQYGNNDKKKKIKIKTKQFQSNEIDFQFLLVIDQLISENFDCSKYYKKNQNKINQLQTFYQYGEEQYPHNIQKQKQIQNIQEENQDSFNYILNLRRGDNSFFRTTMTGFIISLFNQQDDDEEDFEQNQLIKQIFIKFYYTECQDIALLEKPFDGVSDLNLSINYKYYFLNCLLYLFAHRFSDYSDSYIIFELLKMCYKDDAFDFAMVCFGISLCNHEMINLKNNEDFSQFFDNTFGQIDIYQFEMNEIYQQSLSLSLQVDIRLFNLIVDQKEKQRYIVVEERIIPGQKQIIFKIKMIKNDNIYRLIFDQREERKFKYAKKKAKKADNLKQPLIKLESYKYFQQQQKYNKIEINEQKLSKEEYKSQSQDYKIQNDQEFNKKENNLKNSNINIDQNKKDINQTSKQQLNKKSSQCQILKNDINKASQTIQNQKEIIDNQQQTSSTNLSYQIQQQNQNPIQQNINHNNNQVAQLIKNQCSPSINNQKNHQKLMPNQSLDNINQQSLQQIILTKKAQTFDFSQQPNTLQQTNNPNQIKEQYIQKNAQQKLIEKDFKYIPQMIGSQTNQQQSQQMLNLQQNLHQTQKIFCIKCKNSHQKNCQVILIDLESISKLFKGKYCLRCICSFFQSQMQKDHIYSKASTDNLFYCCKCENRFTDKMVETKILSSQQNHTLEYIKCGQCQINNQIQVYY
ncbi:hypothetical protein TTHERM_00008560 (macronuclear) [Tetrahymena thermophila SB210]|uniref:Uncharacterized protein n=1 Tax=Tetrahymena thermophila (strain SB210) TaxID=312017 RepID=Q22S78_TETTS|nr:hypothetical protein TTHERM_00008560 [Tetrahymena thermophila SB210]EAR87894.2 hypothetical protein TTHERM_00008560 [Tetrahymena thermophila SB210]|eukprot:XP_001008139.2 hypothetical protein TTHERM_00008560 [Tetrahymena thermophila SB210]